ncbi:YheC/YheD family protein [Paenibacillus doosanensis]|uniref:YheC/YheD family endospore coat-associated protein n=1 Tax=Paenibacillus doosanensis TaxID=1229154 RepID=UPI00217FDA2B|nr:YheC/YheD family protein [Paenibacillus doosanensis]MCS7458866.1 YheC/YheD family protein [Paenibacillus doosanensis]
MESPYVGILVNDKLHSRLPSGNTQYEAVDFYVEAAGEYGLTPCFFRIQDVKRDTFRVNAYVKENGRFVQKHIPLPAVIHNRAIYNGSAEYNELSSWVAGGTRLFNQWNRYGKLRVHELLMQNPDLRPHLPGTSAANTTNIGIMMKLYDKIIIKPDRSSIGRGVMLLQKIASGWKLTYPVSLSVRNKKKRHLRFRGPRLPALLVRRLKKMPYIVQQCLALATYRGRPFDLRVSVQRDGSGLWQVTGLVAKVAPKGSFLTNVAQGGTVHRLEDILAEEYPLLDGQLVYAQLCDFSLRVCRYLGEQLPHLADLGLDVGMTKDGYPLFVECNGKDQRYSLREAGLLDEWKASFFNPIAYSKYLLDSCVKEQIPQKPSMPLRGTTDNGNGVPRVISRVVT